MPGGDLGLGQQRPRRAEGEWGCWGKPGSQNPCGAGGVVLCPRKWEPLLCMAGPLCKYEHTQRVLCANYLVGFCPEGPKCKFMQYVWGRLGGAQHTAGGAQRGTAPSPRLRRWTWPLRCLG